MSAILPRLHDDVVSHASLSDVDKALICDKLAQVEQCLVDFSQLNPNLPQLNTNLSQLNTNLTQLNPNLSQLNPNR